MRFSPDHLAGYLPGFKAASRVYVAFSGGLDSTVLLHSVRTLLGENELTAIHVNHQLSDNADNWLRHCEEVARQLAVNFIGERVAVRDAGDGLEQAAREARYSVFENYLEENDILLMAHHADDQAETVLFRLLRGSGSGGLAGMPRRRALGRGQLLRPLLDISRRELQEYAQCHNLQWIEDEANANLSFDRNFIRHLILPELKRRWIDAESRINHSATLCREASGLVAELAESDIENLEERWEFSGWSLDAIGLRRLCLGRQKSLLRHWIERRDFPVPGHRVIDTVVSGLLPAREDAEPLVRWRGAEIRRFAGRIYLLTPLSAFDDTIRVTWNADKPLSLPGVGELSFKAGDPSDDGAPICFEVRFRQGGERCKPLGRAHSQSLKKLMQEYRIPTWLRHRVPLMYVEDQLVAVGDYWRCDTDHIKLLPDEWMILWRHALS